jgi:RNA polymerase sigma factor (sigma-70 family)
MSAPLVGVRLLAGDEAAVYAAHHVALRCAVRAAVRGPDACVEDACAFAWLQFLRCQPTRDTAFAWLKTVAIRQAWRLVRRERHDGHLEEVPAWQDRHGTDTTAAAIDARQALHAVSQLPERQRRYLTLAASGHTHPEIARATGATQTNVHKHLKLARNTVRAT